MAKGIRKASIHRARDGLHPHSAAGPTSISDARGVEWRGARPAKVGHEAEFPRDGPRNEAVRDEPRSIARRARRAAGPTTRFMPRNRHLERMSALHPPLAAVGIVGAVVGSLFVGLLLGAVVLAIRLLVFDAPLRDAATLAAGAAAGATLVGAVLVVL